MMFFTTAFTLLTAALAVVANPAPTAQVTYDRTYDNTNGSLNGVACSNGPNGLVTKGKILFSSSGDGMFTAFAGYTTFGSLPSPFIGGVAGVSWNSPDCGSCWKLSYQGQSINVIAVDYAGSGFNIAFSAMNKLTNGQAEFLGHVDAQFQKVDPSECGF